MSSGAKGTRASILSLDEAIEHYKDFPRRQLYDAGVGHGGRLFSIGDSCNMVVISEELYDKIGRPVGDEVSASFILKEAGYKISRRPIQRFGSLG